MADVILTAMTENGDRAFSTSGNACLDFFTRITRSAPFADYVDAFSKAWLEDKETAVRILFNMRDVRNGKGEKLIPAVIMVYLKFNIEPNVYEAILRKMVEYGYWKDLLRIIEMEMRMYRLQKTRTRKYDSDSLKKIGKASIEVRLFVEQLKIDAEILADPTDTSKRAAISLCGKWAPSEDTHYDHHPMYAAQNIMEVMGMKPKEYRQLLTKLRAHLGILEMLMSTQQYDKIDFSKLPSIAMMKMKRSFMRDTNADGVESTGRKQLHLSYGEYLKKLAEGKTKVNIKGIQPHELVSTYINGNQLDLLVEAQWKELKQRVLSAGVFKGVTAIVDVSGSMNGQPMEVAIALGILVAECTTVPFNGKVITFSDVPSWHQLVGETLCEKVQCMKGANWGRTTNLHATLNLILADAKSAQLTQEQMVKTLFIFTDMQFNQCDQGKWESTFEYAKRTFAEAGYQLPRIVCWNLRTSTVKTMPVIKNEEGYAMLSGFSAELLKCILTAQEFTPISMMMHVLEPYAAPEAVKTCNTANLSLNLTTPLPLEKAIEQSAVKKGFKQPKTNAAAAAATARPVLTPVQQSLLDIYASAAACSINAMVNHNQFADDDTDTASTNSDSSE